MNILVTHLTIKSNNKLKMNIITYTINKELKLGIENENYKI